MVPGAQQALQDAVQRNHHLEDRLRDEERERDQALNRIRELEDQLRPSQMRVRALEEELRQARAAVPKPAEKKLDPSKAYQIKIRHEPRQQCPALPQGFAYDEKEFTSDIREKRWNAHSYCVHTVLTQHWPIARMRKEVERLKNVPGLLSIWIAKNGRPVQIGGVGYNTDMWRKQDGRWVKD